MDPVRPHRSPTKAWFRWWRRAVRGVFLPSPATDFANSELSDPYQREHRAPFRESGAEAAVASPLPPRQALWRRIHPLTQLLRCAQRGIGLGEVKQTMQEHAQDNRIALKDRWYRDTVHRIPGIGRRPRRRSAARLASSFRQRQESET